MYKITNIKTLGTDYTVADQNGEFIKIIQIIPYNEILDAALGEYDESFGDIQTYLEESAALLEGAKQNSPYRVYWYATEEEEVDLSDIIQHAITHDYDKIVLEHLEPQ